MFGLDLYDLLFIGSAFLFQIILIIHFALRKWHFEFAIRHGPLVYAMSLPAVAVSLAILLGGKTWTFWLAGFLYLAWAAYGYFVEYIKEIKWRNPLRWSLGGPYVTLYLATIMFYWWPLAPICKPLWYAYAALFVASTFLNISSHWRPPDLAERL